MTQKISFSRVLHRRFVMTWCAMGTLLLPIAFFIHSFSPLLSDNFFYDAWLSKQVKPPSADILIVAIDEPSLHMLGRWPWPRDIHAQLVHKLNLAGVESIVLDILFVEPSREPAEDALLADAMHQHGNVYLPIALLPEQLTENGMRDVLVPSPPLQAAAKGLGHINIALDGDGVARSVKLLKLRRGEAVPQLMTVFASNSPRTAWPSTAVRIPFRGSSGTYPTVSYSDVLKGYVPESLLYGRKVLVGMTALGLGDNYNVSLLSSGLMSGVEVNAHLLDALESNTYIREVNDWVGSLLAITPIVLLMLLAWYLRFRYLLAVVICLGVGVFLASFIALSFRWWWPPSASLIALGIAFVTFVWKSQSVLLSWFEKEIELLYKEPSILPAPARESSFIYGEGGKLYQQSQALEFALGRIIEGRRFILGSMNSLPLPIFVLNKKGEVLLANKQAEVICWMDSQRVIRHINELSSVLAFEESIGFASPWPPQLPVGRDARSIETGWLCTDSRGRTYRMEMGNLSTTASSVTDGWLVWLVDLTSEIEAEAQRSSMLSFLSHDMKAPQARALALLDAQKDPVSAVPESTFYSYLGQCLNVGLDMINDFIELTKARSFDFDKQVVLFEDVVMEVLDKVFPIARLKNIKLLSELENEDGAPVLGDRSYLSRAVFNVIENAVKYTPRYGEVSVHVFVKHEWVVLEVVDNGVGVLPEKIDSIFDEFKRGDEEGGEKGHGLGLSLVKVVAEKHDGIVMCESELGKGSRFTLTIPSFKL
ncbi:MAG: CHASE2 domain-containing protein [Halomonas sp.]|nr:CHASE2 and HATPase_c domain-containing protein [Halomonas sp.]MCC5904507.1 CHASE2 domain-containing protein [Halomonas sp.]